MVRCKITVLFIFGVFCLTAANKYSKEANKNKSDVDFRKLVKPFRMAKLNLVWMKAQERLTEAKLKSLYSDLMVQDKEEITQKHFKNDGGDNEGLREAELRRKLTGIMTAYGLTEHFEDSKGAKKYKEHRGYNEADDYINKSIFKDKKLNQLWGKAEVSGFTREELAALREEFHHHQEKIDQYYDLLNSEDEKKDDYKNVVDEEEHDKFNEIVGEEETNKISKHYLDKKNLIRDKHRGLRDGYDRLQRLAAKGPNNKEFIEPKVQRLWQMAAESNFTVDELASLKVELQHYESRLLKLRHLQADHLSQIDKHKVAAASNKMDHFDEAQQMIKKHTRKVEKIHSNIENKILERHSEL